jgi:hypothetical protein
MRLKPIAAVTLGAGETESIVVVFEDGHMYEYAAKSGKWSELPPVPKTEAAELADEVAYDRRVRGTPPL